MASPGNPPLCLVRSADLVEPGFGPAAGGKIRVFGALLRVKRFKNSAILGQKSEEIFLTHAIDPPLVFGQIGREGEGGSISWIYPDSPSVHNPIVERLRYIVQVMKIAN